MKTQKNTGRIVVCAFAMFVFFGFTATFANGQRYSRIKFERGKTSKTVYGTLNGFEDKKIFKIRVRAGQTLSTEEITDSRNHLLTIYVSNPAGENVNDMDASCHSRNRITPTEDGDYTLEVIECRKADEWSGGFSFRVSVN